MNKKLSTSADTASKLMEIISELLQDEECDPKHIKSLTINALSFVTEILYELTEKKEEPTLCTGDTCDVFH
jgi:hypothetical protein